MKHIKYFEDQKNMQKFYWGVRNKKGIFKKSLEKVGCPEDMIFRLLELLDGFSSDDSIFVCYDPYIKWNNWALSESGVYLQNEGYIYQGAIPLTKEEYKEIEIEEEAEKYNL